jgi:hypothetical protein
MVGRPLTRKLAEKAIIENNDMEIAREELGKNIARWAVKATGSMAHPAFFKDSGPLILLSYVYSSYHYLSI